MPSLTSFVVIGLLVYGFMYAVIRFSLSTPHFKSMSPEDQARARRTYRWALRATPFALVAVYLLSLAPPDLLKWMPVLLYLGLWVLALWLLWRAYQLGVRKDTRHAKGPNGRPLVRAEQALRPLALLFLFTGLGLAAMLVCFVVFAVPLSSWAALVTVLSAVHVLVMQRIDKRYGR